MNHSDIDKLKQLQPELVAIGNKISGCFHVSASLRKRLKRRGVVLDYYPYSCQNRSKDGNFIYDTFYIDITLVKKPNAIFYPNQVFETSGKLLSWKSEIPSEFWHVNNDDSLCLGTEQEILEFGSKYDFADFINQVVAQYFYYMIYVKDRKREPWEAYRHGLFLALEHLDNGIAFSPVLEIKLARLSLALKFYYDGNTDERLISNILGEEWHRLLKKTLGRIIGKKDYCPFCQYKRLAKSCNDHIRQIRGYNKLFSLFH